MLGQTLGGRYQILEQIGKGGFGVTFLALDMQRPHQPKCVVKQFKPIFTDPYTLQVGERMFHREAETLEKLGKKHDQIPQLLAHFEENQEFYIVQEYIEGHDLSVEIPLGQQQSETFVIKLLHDILEVLAFVHQNNDIHRDIKPTNIRRRQSDNKIVLIDFGAVKQIMTQVINSQGHTSLTVPLGTYGYMPSEQANGNPQLSSDIYAVGMIGIQALTGVSPVSLPKDKTGEVVWRDRVKVSPKLANILDKMVRYDYRQRYQSATEALQAVKKISISIKSPLWKILIGVGIAAALISLIIWVVSRRSPTLNFLPYDNREFGIKIKYPDNWISQELQKKRDSRSLDFGEIAQFSPNIPNPTTSCNTEMVLHINKQLLSLNEAKNLALKEIKRNNPNTPISDQSNSITLLSNSKAYKLMYTRQDGQCNLQVMEIGTVRSGKVYFITYTADVTQYDKFLPIVEEMIKSFQIIEVN